MASSHPVRVSVLIRALNEEAHIGRLLTGIRHQRRDVEQIVLVDSGSTDATVPIAREFDAEVVSIEPDDFSFGRALNLGFSACAGDLVVLASAHVYPIYPSWIERLTDPFEDERIALTYGQQRGPAQGRFSEQQILRQWFPDRSEIPQRHPFCNNANAAVRREVWEELRYDESLTGLEDLDWAKRALDAGHLLGYVANAPIVHVHDESFAQVMNRYRREAIAHKAIYPEQDLSAGAAARLVVSGVLRDFAAARRERVLGDQAADIVSFRVAQYLGTHRGFRQQGPVTETLRRRFFYPAAKSSQTPSEDTLEEHPIEYDELT